MMNTYEAAKVLRLTDHYSIYDVRNAYRRAMTGSRSDKNDIQEAFVVLSNDLGAKVPAGRPGIDLDPQFAAKVINGFYHCVSESEDEKDYRREMDLPLDAPANYRLIRGIVQHAPYRIIFFVLANLFFQVPYLMLNPDSLGYCLFGLLLLNVSFINLMFPLVTRPLRKALIDLVDNIFANIEFHKTTNSTEIAKTK